MTGGTLAELFASLKADPSHPPLDYLVSWAVQRAGGGEAALRGVAALWSLAAAALLAIRAGGAARTAASLGAAAAFVVFPASVHYGQEVRPYALALALVAGADVALDAARRGRRGAGVLFTVLATASVATLYFAVFPLAALGLDELLRARRERRRPVPAVFAGGAAAALFLAAWFAWGAARPAASVPPDAAWRRFPAALLGLATYREETTAWPFLAAAVWGAAAVGVAAAGRERARLGLLFAATVGGPAAVLLATGWFWALRYFLFALLPLSLALGETFARLAPAWLRAAAAAALLLSLSRPLGDVVRGGRPDWRTFVGVLESARAAGLGGDVIVADPWSLWCVGAQLPRARLPVLAATEGELASAVTSRREGWIVRTPHHPAPPGVDAFLPAPWWQALRAEDAAVYRFEDGRLVPRGARALAGPGGEVVFPDGGGLATPDAITTLQVDTLVVVSGEPREDGVVSTDVRITDDVGSPFEWVGLAARRPASGGRGVIGLVRANGEAVLHWEGGEKSARPGVDPRRGMRLVLACAGERCTFAVNGARLLEADVGTPAKGAWGLEARALARATRLTFEPPLGYSALPKRGSSTER